MKIRKGEGEGGRVMKGEYAPAFSAETSLIRFLGHVQRSTVEGRFWIYPSGKL
jgi:hypothetical protein